MTIIIFFIVGSIIGSFLNVCIYRIPRKESINFPPSHCFQCKKQLKARDLVPIISYVFLKGKCRNCGTHISFQYPVVEIITGALFGLTAHTMGVSLDLLITLLFFSCLLVVAVIDLKTMEIPFCLQVVLFILAIINFIVVNTAGLTWIDAMLGVLVSSGSLLLFYLLGLFVFHKEIIGMGDIKLFVPLGLYLGMEQTLLCMYLSVVLGGIAGVYLLIQRKQRNSMMPFGPYIVLGTIVVVLYGERLLNLYYSYVFG